VKKISDKVSTAGGNLTGYATRARGQARRSEAVQDTRALLGHWLPVAADPRVSKDSRSDAHDVSFSSLVLSLFLLRHIFLSRSRIPPFSLFLLVLFFLPFLTLAATLKNPSSRPICLNCGSNRYPSSIGESPINSFIIHLCRDTPGNFSRTAAHYICKSGSNYNTSVLDFVATTLTCISHGIAYVIHAGILRSWIETSEREKNVGSWSTTVNANICFVMLSKSQIVRSFCFHD